MKNKKCCCASNINYTVTNVFSQRCITRLLISIPSTSLPASSMSAALIDVGQRQAAQWLGVRTLLICEGLCLLFSQVSTSSYLLC